MTKICKDQDEKNLRITEIERGCRQSTWLFKNVYAVNSIARETPNS